MYVQVPNGIQTYTVSLRYLETFSQRILLREPFQYTSHLGYGRFFKRAFPYANYLVPQKSECARDFSVAFYICFDFIAPKRLVGFRQVAFVANSASVPKTSVHEYGNPVFRENEIRMPHQLGVAAPSGDSVFPKQRNKPKFRTFVSLRTDLGHHFRAFLLRHGIHFTISYETQQFAASNRGFDCYWKIGINPHFSVLSKIMEQCKFRRFACRPFLRHRQEPS